MFSLHLNELVLVYHYQCHCLLNSYLEVSKLPNFNEDLQMNKMVSGLFFMSE